MQPVSGGPGVWRAAEDAEVEGVRLGSLDIVTPAAGDPLATQVPGCASVLLLVQALSKQSRRARLWLVTRGAQVAGAGTCLTGPFQATLWGLLPTLQLEHPELASVIVDLDPTGPALAGLVELLRSGTRDDRLALRGGQLRAQRLVRLSAGPGTAQTGAATPIAAAATYLISGGFGSLGMQVARWLVERGARSLLLVGRSQPAAATQAELARLGTAGVQIRTVSADIADADAVARLFAEAAATLPPLRGIVHAAGVVEDRMMLHSEWPSWQRVFAPKLAGAWNLHRHSAALTLDFFVCFSSVAPILGAPGQAPYATANAFLDALVQLRRDSGLPGLSVNWGPWAGGGMASQTSSATQAQWRELGISLLQPEPTLRQLARLMDARVGQVVVAEIMWARYLTQRYAGDWPPFFQLLAQETRPHGSASPAPRGELREQLLASPPGERRSLLTQRLRTLVASVMALPSAAELAPRQPLIDIGMDSLMTLEVRNRLERELDVSLGSTLLIDHPSLEALERHLLEEVLPGGLFAAPAAAPLPAAPGRPPRRGRADELPDFPEDLAWDQVVALMRAELQAIEEERA